MNTQSLKKNFHKWVADTDDRTKLQHTYLGLAALVTVASGVLSLFDAPLGRTLVGLAVGALIIFIVNAIVWALLFSTIARLHQAPQKTKPVRKK